MRSKSILNKSKKTPAATIYEWCFFSWIPSACIGSISISTFFSFYFTNFPLGKEYNWMGLSALTGLEETLPIFLSDRDTEGKVSKYSSVPQVETIIAWLNLKCISCFCTGSALKMAGAQEHLTISEYCLQLLVFNLVLIFYWSLSCQNGRKVILPGRNLQSGLWMTILEASTLEAKRLTYQRKYLFNLERCH